ncbi:MAG TPA: hemerythrin domain-containing protein [Rhodocyclaceae bacterium]|nr:hemerythrin domain-containing protein [Rhodocyclaceae bacterium]HMW77971.1 hemerythrin domain-containing protein [Rhodocyclaceae bacterium]HNE43419.1 hemerythrin domain-containing protein [Rhodocyclaceae bacterium]HNM82127.1 hemerythrin domain-containing protein [Rhodocyclaceae bacterium]HNO87585.1 hemerythrin domain-containing protein [Rhodocyclaceae bacterium]
MKTQREFIALSSTHHRSMKLALDIKLATASGDAERIARMTEAVTKLMSEELDSHFRLEEALLLPALKAAGHGGLASRAQVEHRLLRETASALTSPNAPLLESFADLLNGHVQFEENEIFSVARNCLDDETLAIIAAY